MKLVRLSLEGYRQFRAPVSIDFPDGLTGISGPNGAGKSKIIEAIGYALFGPSRRILPDTDRTADLASIGGGGGVQPRVELLFDLRGHRYRVLRSPQRVGLWIDEDARSQVSAARALTEQVKRLLRLSPSTFRGTFVAHQKDVAGFQSADGTTRKALMNQLIGVAQIDQAITFAEAELEQRHDTRDGLTKAIRTSQEQAEINLGEAQFAYDEFKRSAERMTDAHATAAGHRERSVLAVQAVDRRRQQAEGIERQLAEILTHRRSLADMILSGRRQQLSLAEDERARSEAARQFDRTRAATAEVESCARLKVVVDAREKVEELRRQLDGPLVHRREARRRAEQRKTDLQARSHGLQVEVDGLRGQRTEAATAARRADDERQRVEQQRASAEQLGEKGTCVACGFELGPRLPTVLDHLAVEMRGLAEERDERLTRIVALDAKLGPRQAELEGIADELKRIDVELGGTHGTVMGEIAAAEQALSAAATALAAAQSRLTDAETNLSYDAAAHAAAQAAADEHVAAREALASFARLDERRAAVARTLAQARQDLRAENRRSRGLRGDWRTTLPSDAETIAAQQAERLARRDEESANQVLIGTREQLAGAAERLKAARAMRQEAIEAAGRVQSARRLETIAEETRRALRELYAALSAEAIPALEQRLDAWMPTVLGPRFRAVKLTDDYGIEANNGSGMHGLSHFSGGEQTVLAIMLRAAVALFCRERAGFDRGFLILDEVFGDQDQQRRHLLVQFLEEIKTDFHQIVVVNHIEEISGQLDSVIEVEPVDDNESRVHVSR